MTKELARRLMNARPGEVVKIVAAGRRRTMIVDSVEPGGFVIWYDKGLRFEKGEPKPSHTWETVLSPDMDLA